MMLNAIIRGKVHSAITKGLYKSGNRKLAKASSTLWKIERIIRIMK